MPTLEKGPASGVQADGALVGIPGFESGYITVGGTKIALRADRPPIILRSGAMNLSVSAQSYVGEVFFPFKTILIALKGILSTGLTGSDGKVRFGGASAGTYLDGYTLTSASSAAGTVVDFFTSVTGYDATTMTGIRIAANTRLGFGTSAGTAASNGVLNMTAVLVPDV